MYVVWHKGEYADTWERYDCADLDGVTGQVLELVRKPGTVEVTAPLAWRVGVEVLDYEPAAPSAPAPDLGASRTEHPAVRYAAEAARAGEAAHPHQGPEEGGKNENSEDRPTQSTDPGG